MDPGPKMVWAIWLMAGVWMYPSGSGLPLRRNSVAGSRTMCTLVALARYMMPASMVAPMTPSSSSVVAAFLLFGGRKLGTPLLMASTPVSAAATDEKARSSRKAPASPTSPSSNPGAGTIVNAAEGASPSCPVAAWNMPTAVMPRMAAMKR